MLLITHYALPVFSICFEVDVGSWEVDVAKCQQYFAETENLTELKALLLDKLLWDAMANSLF